MDTPVPAARALSDARGLFGGPLVEWLAVVLLCGGLAAGASWNGWLWRIDTLLYDAAMTTQRLPADPAVAVVAIDDQSLGEIGHWPWPRAVHAALIERLTAAGARVVALDILFAEPSESPAGDAALANAMRAHGRVVLPVTQGMRAAASAGEAWPLPLFAKAAAAIGHIHIELDPDGIARSVYLWEGMRRPAHPQLALAALGLFEPSAAAQYAVPAQTEADEGWRREAWFHIPFIGPPGSYPYISYVDVLRGRFEPEALAGKVVFVGATAVGMSDIVPTPTSGHARPMPGVEVHATLFGALRGDMVVQRVDRALVAPLAALTVSVLLVLMLRAGPRFTMLAGFTFLFVILLASWSLLTVEQWWLPPSGALAGSLLAYPLWSWRRLEAAQRYLDAELAALGQPAGPLGGLALPGPAMADAIDPFRERIELVREAARRERALQRFTADTLEGLPVGALVTGPDGQIRLANRQAGLLLGTADAEAQRALLAAMPWPEGGFPPGEASVEVDLPDGHSLLVSASPLADEAGRPLGAVFGLADIGPIRAAQRSREDMMYFLSHDLRSPLSALLTLLAEPAGGAKREQRMAGHARKALGMADDLLRLARAESLDPAGFAEVPLEMLVVDAADEVWANARASGIELHTQVAPEAGEDGACVLADRELVFRAVVNLLSNAIKYSSAGTEITLALVPVPGGWEIAVSDQGRGIAPEEQERLFQRFSRVGGSNARGAVGGIGLGLLMVRTVAERHGGSVRVHSKLGEGSTFTLFLPEEAGR
ncbi:CHASE2 domain-containing protein [Pseudothauera nasutitermitis]|uniref:histidine kinase n=1 Tax=Pseudothauera nasutitermitis TaxID=2565930 RepID=A0A4S4AXA5_9RHOO|nr:CHASE2 domain-containing protein [Pseudothauera nasutitermitis]THF64715.1 CHASE2 domain-containing protein [Pseudothauera nasutitermitis]